MYRFVYKYSAVLCFIWALIIFILCATPGQYIPSADWLELLSFDKFVHAFLFFILTALTFISLLKAERAPILLFICFLTCALYGALLEFMQASYFSNRSADWKDVIANTFGCLIAALLLKKLKKFVIGFL